MEYIYTIDQIDDAAAWLLSQIGPHRIVALKGGMGAAAYSEFPVLFKLIDACQDLSVQVHPDDRYAREN